MMWLLHLWFRLCAAKCLVNTESVNAGGSAQTFTDTRFLKDSPVHVCTVSLPGVTRREPPPNHHHQQVINAAASPAAGALPSRAISP